MYAQLFAFGLLAVTLRVTPSVPPTPASPAACGALPGVEALLDIRSLNHVLVGEYHGTQEMPAIAADIMCAAAARDRAVILGVEFTPANQAALTIYLRSTGDAAARAELLSAPAWQGQDPRATDAVLALIEQARVLVRHGKRVAIVAFDHVPQPTISRQREQGLADALTAARSRMPGALVVALTGAGHAGKTPWSSQNPPFPSTGQLIMDGEVISLAYVRSGGQAFGCSTAAPGADKGHTACQVTDLPAREPVRPRGILLDPSLREGFEGVFSTGAAYTSARPAHVSVTATGRVPM